MKKIFKSKFVSGLLATVVIVGTLFNQVTCFAEAASKPIPETSKTKIVNAFKELNIDDSTSLKLAEKLLKTGKVDSIDETKRPIKTYQYSEKNTTYLRHVFEDGSVCVCTIEKGKESREQNPTLFSVSGGTWSGGSYWWTLTRATASVTTGIVNASFYFDAEGSQGNDARITSAYDPGVSVLGGSYSDLSLQYGEHQTQLYFVYTMIGSVIKTTFRLYLFAEGNRNLYTTFSN